MNTLRNSFFSHLGQTSESPLAIQIDRAEGIYMWSENKQYIDCISGIAVSSLGHSQPSVLKAIQNQLESHTHLMVYGEIIQKPQVALAQLLCQHLPKGLDRAYFVNSGSEAIEAAMKLSKRAGGRTHFVAIKKAYHGSTQGALSLMSEDDYSLSFRPLLPNIDFMEQNQLDSIPKLITDQTAAVFVEPIMGEKGYEPCTQDFLLALRKRCDETGTHLVFDEIQTGMGRTGKLFAFEHFEVQPDILVLGKALGAGLPLAALISSDELLDVFKTNPVLGHITTFGGHPLSCAAAHAGLEYLLKSEILSKMDEKEQLFRKLLVHPKIKNISGKGLMLAIELDSEEYCMQVIDTCVKEGLLIDWFLYAAHKIRLAPPLIIKNTEIEKVCGIILDKLK